MNKTVFTLFIIVLLAGCKNSNNNAKRIPVAEVGQVILYLDEIPQLIQSGVNDADSTALLQNYVNKWAKRRLLLQKAEENLSQELKTEIAQQLQETRTNLVIYQYQRQMIQEKMETV